MELKRLIARNHAVRERDSIYGTFYSVTGSLHGPKSTLVVTTIWLHANADDGFKFITLKPGKESDL